ncbi:MAG: SDR family oxidoreductase [Actinobacteria bacterium]|nr:SDR family oxidoreductase [Actinomycetota bacterium]
MDRRRYSRRFLRSSVTFIANGGNVSGRLEGKVVIITGAARGQGLAEVELFRAEGAHVIAGDVLDHDGIFLDVTSAESWAAAVDSAVSIHGRIDVLLNNAGVRAVAPVHQMPIDDFQRVLDINLIGPLLGIQAVVPHMQSGSSIINVSSLNGLAANVNTSAYTTSKFALRGLTKSAALDLGPLGIRVNAILPGVIRTPMVSYIVDEYEERLAAGLPLGRIGEPMDIAGAALFLASDDSAWVSGLDLTVDGGQMASTPKL